MTNKGLFDEMKKVTKMLEEDEKKNKKNGHKFKLKTPKERDMKW